MQAAILINRSANNGKSFKKWTLVKKQLSSLDLNECLIVEYDVPFDIEHCIREIIRTHKIYTFISGGGDGSVNYLLNSLSRIAGDNMEKFTIGAIGLGSSNDFIKPLGNCINSIPVRIDCKKIVLSDIGQVRYEDEKGNSREHLFLINSSVGLLAKGNYLFNKGDRIINFLKKKNVNLAIEYTALKTLVTHKSYELNIESDKEMRDLQLTSLSVVKSPYISGNFKFNQTISPADGFLGVNYSHNESFFDIVRTMTDLKNGKFIKDPPLASRQSYLTNHLKVASNNHVFLETDGEVTIAKNIEFSIYKEQVNLMGLGY